MIPRSKWIVLLLLLTFCASSTVVQSDGTQLSDNITNQEGLTSNFTADSVFPDEIETSPYNEADDDHSHEVFAKPVKKKQYRILQKPNDHEDRMPYKRLDGGHSGHLDFNLDDDLDEVHQTLKRGDLNSKEIHLVGDVGKLQHSKSDSMTPPIFFETTETLSVGNSSVVSSFVRTPLDTLNSSRHVYKVAKSPKSKTKSHELLKKDQALKTFGNQFNSVGGRRLDENNATDISSSGENYFQLMVNLYDHFYWQPTEIRSRVSSACGVELLAYLSALNNNFEWAQRVYDSSGRYRGQFHYGNDIWLGAKIFCQDVNNRNERLDRKRFELGFFVVRVLIRMQQKSAVLQIGECLPKSCTTDDVKAIMDLDPHARIFNGQNSTKSPFVKVNHVRRVPGDYSLWKDIKFQIFGGICLSLALIILIATIYEQNIETSAENTRNSSQLSNQKETVNGKISSEITTEKAFELYQMNRVENNNVDVEGNFKYRTAEQGKTQGEVANENRNQKKDTRLHQKLLLCFALGSNADTILNLDKMQESSCVSCVHGIRVISLLWTIMVHTYLQLFGIGENRFRRNISEQSFIYQIIGNATFSVDSFYFISGLLVTLLFLRHQKDNKYSSTRDFAVKGGTQGFIMIIYRYIRLTPAYLFVIVFNQLMLKHIFNGSVFQSSVADNVTCGVYWWRNILYINNWYPFQELCMIWSWYLANDMQFYIMAIILLIISTRHFKTSFLIIMFFLITSWGTAGFFSLHHQYTHKVADPFESFDFLYDKPWQRIGTYIVGMITGHIIHHVKTPPRVPFMLNLLLWVGSLGLLFILIFGVWEGELSVLPTAFYVSIGHTAWGIGLVWITLSCSWGLSETINKVLSYRGFLPLSRLTYCTYLVHPVLMLIISFQMEGPIHLQHPIVLTVFFGNAVLSFMVAFLISVSFEAPVIRLLKILFRK